MEIHTLQVDAHQRTHVERTADQLGTLYFRLVHHDSVHLRAGKIRRKQLALRKYGEVKICLTKVAMMNGCLAEIRVLEIRAGKVGFADGRLGEHRIQQIGLFENGLRQLTVVPDRFSQLSAGEIDPGAATYRKKDAADIDAGEVHIFQAAFDETAAVQIGAPETRAIEAHVLKQRPGQVQPLQIFIGNHLVFDYDVAADVGNQVLI